MVGSITRKVNFLRFSLCLFLIGVVIAVIFSVQSSFILAGGSDSLSLSHVPNVASQFIALVCVVLAGVFFVWSPIKKKVNALVRALLGLVVVWLFVISGFSFSISARDHAFKVKWYLLPLSQVSFDPSGNFYNFQCNKTPFSLSVANESNESLVVLSQPFYWGVDLEAVITSLNDFGFGGDQCSGDANIN